MSKTMCVIVAVLALVISFVLPGKCLADGSISSFEKNLFDATALLASVDKDGNTRMCTATAFERDGKKYHFLTAAHCVLKEGKPIEEIWLMLFGDAKKNDSVFAKFLAVDAKYNGDGFAVFEAELKDDSTPTIPIATRDALLGEEVSSVSFPNIRPKHLFRGYVSRENQDFEFFGKNSKGFVSFQLYAAPGSSGAAIISRKEGAIVAVVQSIDDSPTGGTAVTGLAISNFKKFWAEFKNKPKQKAK